ncbi:TetR/AcrR family transcriptional regulator [Sandaracinus amylolyticus]|uniref:Transcriptional regulator, TetR family protein n=1 Tax=Sandaracinus amylolyticus TaxID=927083 RepID=A0A0F6W125_9BACT|nr:TetR/AcrR family transcriptional regulator [Sandaracinus amylolyticus]AKF04717.1 Transcriptional regulator, TetR family protein [Sandaracinus amylolyticus]
MTSRTTKKRASKKESVAPPRVRRSAEDAQRAILDAAEVRLAERGPDSIRLQDVARAVGMSHSTVLHHFGSREALLEAVVKRAMERLTSDMLTSFAAGEDARDPAAMLERVFEAFGGGQARMLSWLRLTGIDVNVDERYLLDVARAAHALRPAGANGKKPPFEDTLFTMILASLAAYADGIAGEPTRRSAGLAGDPGAAKRFRAWLARLLSTHLG